MGNFGSIEKPWGELKVTAAEQREHEVALFAKRVMDVPNNVQIRLDYGSRADGQPDYEGFGARGLGADAQGWLIYKYTYSGDPGDMTLRQCAYDIWDDRDDVGTTYA